MWLFDLCFPQFYLICQCADNSKYFREALGLRDKESRLYCFVFLDI